jgi:murein L,D-transpeptidase YcbB/YkuD
VKFNFPNKEAIFLHDTNHRGDFGKKYRAFSSGCIRVHHPKDFASFILRDSTYNSEGIESVIKKRATKSVKLKRDIGVHIVYLTNAVDSMGNVVRVKDVYKWDKKLAARL